MNTPLQGEWRHNAGIICCGTLRIAQADFDTDPTEEVKKEILDWVCKTLNDEQERRPIFHCPKCGSNYYGTCNTTGDFNDWIGKCKKCSFKWERKYNKEYFS